LLLADFDDSDWGIYEYEDTDERRGWKSERPVTRKLAVLIESGKRYPPALALARAEVAAVCDGAEPSEAQFESIYARAIEEHLKRQPEAPYLLAKSTMTIDTDLTEGEWFWLLDVSGSPQQVRWLSDDFHIYSDGIDTFDLTGQQLKQLGYTG
jgi:hypothetical protein